MSSVISNRTGRLLRLAAALLFLGTALACGTGADPRPNVLLILIEDQGAHLGRLGTPGLSTPRMDALAREGTFWRNAFVAVPVCSASKAALYTGMYGHSNGLMGNTLDYMKPAAELTDQERAHPFYGLLRVRSEVPTLVEILHEAGYYSGVTRKLNVTPNEKFPFDEFIADTSGRPVARFLERASATGTPFLLVHNIRPPHRPFRNSHQTPIDVRIDDVRPPAFLPDTPVVRRDWAEYLDSIQLADAEVGLALDSLIRSGHADDTIVAVMSDHGPAFQRGKMAVYDFGLRVPLIVAGPGLRKGFDSDALVSEIDLMPTLLELLGLDVPPSVQGRSFAPQLRGDPGADEATREHVFAELGHGVPLPQRGMQERSVFDGRYQLIYRERIGRPRIVNKDLREWVMWGNRTYAETIAQRAAFPDAYRSLQIIDPARLGGRPPRVELYDLQRDPDEIDDLARDPAHRAHRDRLLDTLRAWAEETGDTTLRFGRVD